MTNKIVVGSYNQAKINAVASIFKDFHIKSQDAPSHVASQPFSDQETIQGAINRAKYCQNSNKGAIGIGLEGGVMRLKNQLFLCNWGALVDQEEQLYIAGGARVPVPEKVAEALEKGEELGTVMRRYTGELNVSQNAGAIGVFTNNMLSRQAMFEHVVIQLKGQYEIKNQISW
ncbi:inosine/xanthosine triphosphatase [Amphibacillus marinus]|uniref:inosine/xanthosine triphosphatase n=1 Tax=Amphibacillus marinus TaxID=872970 RepID=A0A1H8SZL6_9BACI|nr:DUF84 family protein [Amphibacillus marinus]SEO83965.1 inosine/xanthosine triphosphatase [Amphibacillus marinus]